MDDHRHVVGLAAAIEGEAVAEGDAGFVEVIAMVGGDDDDGVVREAVALDGGEDFADAIVEFAGASVIERADLGDFLGWQGLPFRFEVGAADEGIDVEVHAVAVAALIGGIREHADIGFRAAVGEMVAGIEDVPEERFVLLGGGLQAPLDALGDDLGGDELGEGLGAEGKSDSPADCRNTSGTTKWAITTAWLM